MTAYYANITFPSTALGLHALSRWYRKQPADLIADNESTVTYANPCAEFGHLGVTMLLDAMQVPYDHFHRNETKRNIYTEQVRFVEGVRTAKIVRSSDHLIKRFAEEALSLLDLGDIDKLREVLIYTIEKEVGPDIGTYAKEWDPETQYVLFSTDEARDNDGAGYWSDSHGWAGIECACLYSEIHTIAAGEVDGAVWITLAQALEPA